MEILLMVFPKKFLFGANKSSRTQNGTSSQLSIHCKSCFTILHNGRGQGRHRNYINDFSEKKSYSGRFGHFVRKMIRTHNSGFAVRSFFLILYKKGAKRYMKILLVVFRKKISFGSIWSFRLFFTIFYCLAWSILSQATVTIGSLDSKDMTSFMITTGSLNSQDMIRTLKPLGHGFSDKRLCDGYCMNSVWMSIFNRGSYGFVKKLL